MTAKKITKKNFPRFGRDKLRFMVRAQGGGLQVYGMGLLNVCHCSLREMAYEIAKALEKKLG